MSTSLRPTVRFSDSEGAPTYLIIITSCQVFKNLGKEVVFLSKLHRLTSPPASAGAQIPGGNDLSDRIRQLLDIFYSCPGLGQK